MIMSLRKGKAVIPSIAAAVAALFHNAEVKESTNGGQATGESL